VAFASSSAMFDNQSRRHDVTRGVFYISLA